MRFDDDDDAPQAKPSSRSRTPRAQGGDGDASAKKTPSDEEAFQMWNDVQPAMSKLEAIWGTDSHIPPGTSTREQADRYLKDHDIPLPAGNITTTKKYMERAKEAMENSWKAGKGIWAKGKGRFAALVERSRESTPPKAERKRSVSTHPRDRDVSTLSRDRGPQADNFDTAVGRVIAEQESRSQSRRSRI
jgi:hypothetical protein